MLAIEGGIKASVINDKVDLTAAWFHYNYNNKQVLGTGNFPPFGPLPELQNIPRSTARGFEFEITARPTEGLRVAAGATYVDSHVDHDYLTTDPLGTPIDIKGESFPNTPKWQLIGDAGYDYPVTSTLKAFVGSNISYRSGSNAAFGDNPTFRFDPYALVGARIGVEDINKKWRVELWGRNVTNKFYWTNTEHWIDTISRTTGLPATYGITVSGRF